MYYYLSIGSNIQPEKNIGLCIEALLQQFTVEAVFPGVYTKPEEINSGNIFINSLLILQSSDSAQALKQTLNHIETTLGRDRQDPERSIKDRTCDIDILLCSDTLDYSLLRTIEEPYLKSVLKYDYSPQAKIIVFGQRLPQRPSAIHLDRLAGDEAVVIDELDSLVDW